MKGGSPFPFLVSELSQVTCFGQWDIRKCDEAEAGKVPVCRGILSLIAGRQPFHVRRKWFSNARKWMLPGDAFKPLTTSSDSII